MCFLLIPRMKLYQAFNCIGYDKDIYYDISYILDIAKNLTGKKIIKSRKSAELFFQYKGTRLNLPKVKGLFLQ